MSARDSRSVVVAVDGKPGSAGALRYAVDQAVRGDESLHLVHVWPGYLPQDLVPVVAWAELQAEGRAVLDQSTAFARDIAPGLEITTELVVGPRVAGVLAAARGGRLLVVGRSPHHRVEAPRGGTPAALATRAECPVVVVPSTWTAGPAPGRIVVAMKSRTHARELLSHAFDIAQDRDAKVVVVTAWELYDPTMDREEARDHAAEWEAEGIRVLEELVAEWRGSYPDGAGRPPGRPRSRRLRARAGVGRCGPPPHGPSPALRAAVRTPRRHRSPCAADEPVPGRGRSRRRRRRGSCIVLGRLAHDLTLVPTDRASWPSRRTPRRDVLAVHHTKLRRITAPGPPSGGRHGADHHPLGRTGVPE